MASIGENIRFLRKERGLSQEKLEILVNLPKKSVHFYETGKREVPMHVVIELAKFFKVSVQTLMGEPDEKEEPTPESEMIRKILDAVTLIVSDYEIVPKR